MNDVARGVAVVVKAIVFLAILAVVITVVGAGIGIVWEFFCRVVPLLLVVVLAIGGVIGNFWLIGFIVRKCGG